MTMDRRQIRLVNQAYDSAERILTQLYKATSLDDLERKEYLPHIEKAHKQAGRVQNRLARAFSELLEEEPIDTDPPIPEVVEVGFPGHFHTLKGKFQEVMQYHLDFPAGKYSWLETSLRLRLIEDVDKDKRTELYFTGFPNMVEYTLLRCMYVNGRVRCLSGMDNKNWEDPWPRGKSKSDSVPISWDVGDTLLVRNTFHIIRRSHQVYILNETTNRSVMVFLDWEHIFDDGIEINNKGITLMIGRSTTPPIEKEATPHAEVFDYVFRGQPI